MKSASLLLLLAVPTFAAEPDWQRCRALTDDAARLSCYDAVAAATDPANAKQATNLGAEATVATVEPASASPAAPVATPPAVSVPVIASKSDQQRTADFGFEQQIAEQIEQISSRIPGRFTGWQPKSKITLENGQVWQVVDGSRGQYQLENPEVKIERGLLGSFFLNIDGANKSPKVKRIK